MCLVVIVDDRATNRAIYTQLARSIGQGVDVRAFGDPEEALSWLAVNRVDLIVTDYEMPRIVGDEFISRFRGLPHSGGVPIMMVTINDRRQLRLRALESGATDFLQAPVDHCEFLTRARNLLKLSRGAAAPVQPAGVQPVPEPDDQWDDETRRLLDRCGQGGYAFHFIEISLADQSLDLTPALTRHLRGDDLAIRIDPSRYVLLQGQVSGPPDARALARRMVRARSSFKGVAAFSIGTALPRGGEGAPRQRAAECLREARRSAREAWRVENVSAPLEQWGLAPIVELRTGALAGVQVMNGGSPAEASGEGSGLRVALACAADVRLSGDDSFRIGLRLGFGPESLDDFLPRLPQRLAEACVRPSRLDLIICAGEIIADAARARPALATLTMAGVSLTLDLGGLAQAGRRPSELIDACEEALALTCDGARPQTRRPEIRLPCQSADGVELARDLCGAIERACAGDALKRAPLLLADGVPSAALLSALRRAGASRAQGPCFGAPFAWRDLGALLAARHVAPAGAPALQIEARRA
ncbi:response regulator [Rhodoblastus sp.]|jgi:CheY-like chemotaxis protein|uniref:response regulator n=1 Tax=Rhodoblastus sp. TaxID=1962975 RepID=UPI0025D4EECC|nr:response regulator [Rhodoblastus sp.]